jgi:molecular chaperone DnaK
LAEAHNKLDNLVYTTEKTLKDNGAALDEATRKSIEDALAAAREKLESKDRDEINRTTEALMAASHKLAEMMYSKSRQGAGAQAGAGGPTGDDGNATGGAGEAGNHPHEEKKEDVVDADFKEVK